MINRIKNNEEVRGFVCKHNDSVIIRERFTNQAWQLLGRYIANNTHLYYLYLGFCGLTDEKMARLFGKLTNSDSIKILDLSGNPFGIEGVRSMMPFLNSCSLRLSEVRLGHKGNNRIDTECFELIVSSLHGTCIQELSFMECNITSISSLETYSLPNLQKLYLCGNNIGRDGCIIVSNLLQNEGSTLTDLQLSCTGMGYEEAEILTNSLKHNTKLNGLSFENNITERGYKVFLKLVIDVSSIESTYNSNNTLSSCHLGNALERTRAETFIISHINSAVQLNKLHQNSHVAGREKVIKYQLNSQTRKVLCQLQDIDFSYSNIFADIDPILLPNIIALIGERHGQRELYTALIHTAPDLLSYVDRRALLKDEKDRNAVQRAQIAKQVEELTRQLDILVAEDDQLDNRLALIELGDSKASVVDEGKEGGSGEKRQRIR